jgi:hypothetical protein
MAKKKAAQKKAAPKKAAPKKAEPKKAEPKKKKQALTTPPAVAPIDPLHQTIIWLVDGARTEDIADSIRGHFPKADPAKLLELAADHFATVAASDERVVIGWALEATRELYRLMRDGGDYPGALKAVGDMLKHSNRLTTPEEPEEPDTNA